MNSSYLLLLIYMLDGMILKMNIFLSQWRKFESTRSYIFEDINFWNFWIFLDFFGIYFDFLGDISLFKNRKKGVFFFAGTASKRGEAWDLRGCDMARKAMWQSHASPRWCLGGTDVAWTRGKTTRAHGNARVAPTWQEEWLGRQVMGPRGR